MNEDPIISEVRKVREEHAAKYNYDLDLIVADIKRNEAKLKRKGWKFIPALNSSGQFTEPVE